MRPAIREVTATSYGGTERGVINSVTVEGRTMQLYGRISF